MKKTIKKLVKKIPIAFTKNQQYDKQTNLIIKKVCNTHTNCVDIGAHKGEVLDIMLKYAPSGKHYAFEPLPHMYNDLKSKYKEHTNCHISDIALSNMKGTSTFNYVISNPSYSGLVKRRYDRANEQDTTIEVKTDLLDNVIPASHKIDLIKIDVEGGELLVMQGAKETLKRNKPVIIFEHGLGASDMYGSSPDKVFNLLSECGLKIWVMKDWLKGKSHLSLERFQQLYRSNTEYYFLAHP